jgi:glycosyltransferase involved in cell wall biosynthesis
MAGILEVDSSSGLGGGQRVMFDIVSGLSQEFVFLIASPRGVYSKKYEDLGLRFFELSDNWPIRALRRIIRNESPDILHAHGTRAALWARLSVIGLKNRPALIYTLHGLHIAKRRIPLRWFYLALERFANRWTDKLVCVSFSDRKEVLDYKLISPSRIEVIRNGIRISDFVLDAKAIAAKRKEMRLDNRFVLISVGRLHPQKDFSTLLLAFKEVIKENKYAILLIVGDGPLRSSLEEETNCLDLSENVRFLGFREDIPLLINVSDVLVLSSNWEAFGLVCVEASAAKKPVIASDIEGVRETVMDNETGYLFRKGSATDLAKKIRSLSASEELRKNMGEAGFSFASKNYSADMMVAGYKKLFSDIINK